MRAWPTWTNLWYKPVLGFFGDWFGGPLAPLFGPGINDLEVTGNRPFRWVPGAAHALYLGFPNDRRPGTFTALLGQALDINAASWLPDLHSKTSRAADIVRGVTVSPAWPAPDRTQE